MSVSTVWHGFCTKTHIYVSSTALFLSEFSFLGTLYSTILYPKLVLMYALLPGFGVKFGFCVHYSVLFLREIWFLGTLYTNVICPK